MLGRRPVVVYLEELKELLGLPQEVNIYNVKTNGFELEFEIVSAEPIEGLTLGVGQDQNLLRRIGVRGINEWKEENK